MIKELNINFLRAFFKEEEVQELNKAGHLPITKENAQALEEKEFFKEFHVPYADFDESRILWTANGMLLSFLGMRPIPLTEGFTLTRYPVCKDTNLNHLRFDNDQLLTVRVTDGKSVVYTKNLSQGSTFITANFGDKDPKFPGGWLSTSEYNSDNELVSFQDCMGTVKSRQYTNNFLADKKENTMNNSNTYLTGTPLDLFNTVQPFDDEEGNRSRELMGAISLNNLVAVNNNVVKSALINFFALAVANSPRITKSLAIGEVDALPTQLAIKNTTPSYLSVPETLETIKLLDTEGLPYPVSLIAINAPLICPTPDRESTESIFTAMTDRNKRPMVLIKDHYRLADYSTLVSNLSTNVMAVCSDIPTVTALGWLRTTGEVLDQEETFVMKRGETKIFMDIEDRPLGTNKEVLSIVSVGPEETDESSSYPLIMNDGVISATRSNWVYIKDCNVKEYGMLHAMAKVSNKSGRTGTYSKLLKKTVYENEITDVVAKCLYVEACYRFLSVEDGLKECLLLTLPDEDMFYKSIRDDLSVLDELCIDESTRHCKLNILKMLDK